MDKKTKIVKLTTDNYNKNNIINLLDQLTNCPNIKDEHYKNILNNLSNNHSIYVIDYNNIAIGIGTIFIEQKIIHSGKCVAHIEDVVIDEEYRNNKLGNLLLNFLINKAKELNCYKVILNCNDKTKMFYEKNGFNKTNNQMSLYF